MFLHVSVHREVVPPPLGQYPLDHTFPGPINTPPPPRNNNSGRYASYWNAFLCEFYFLSKRIRCSHTIVHEMGPRLTLC